MSAIPVAPTAGRRPLNLLPGVGIWLTAGLALRLFHYLRDPSLWHDEAALVMNVLRKSYAELLGPLSYSEAAPPLFLWLEKAVSSLFGDSLPSLRLLPFLANCLALVGVVACGRRVLPAAAAPWAALFAACSDAVLWHACEAKPYSVDLLVAAGLLALVVFGRDWPFDRLLAVAALVAPVVVLLSYPGCFLLGGLALWLGPQVVRRRQASSRLLYGLFLAGVGSAFLLLWLGPARAQRDDRLLRCWVETFPNWERPGTVPGWLAVRLSDVFRYACVPTGNALFPVALAGACVLWRRGERRLVAFLAAPVALAAVAGLLCQYPFGAFRVLVFAAPACWIFTGAGVPAGFLALRRLGRWGPAALAVLIFFPVALAGYRALVPWKRADTGPAAAYVRARIRPEEPLVGNAWEDAYYFRDGRVRYLLSETLGPLPCERLWVLVTTDDAEARRAILKKVQVRGPWRVLEMKSFRYITAHHLERERTPSHSADLTADPKALPDPALRASP
jgi:hypothetical protein